MAKSVNIYLAGQSMDDFFVEDDIKVVDEASSEEEDTQSITKFKTTMPEMPFPSVAIPNRQLYEHEKDLIICSMNAYSEMKAAEANIRAAGISDPGPIQSHFYVGGLGLDLVDTIKHNVDTISWWSSAELFAFYQELINLPGDNVVVGPTAPHLSTERRSLKELNLSWEQPNCKLEDLLYFKLEGKLQQVDNTQTKDWEPILVHYPSSLKLSVKYKNLTHASRYWFRVCSYSKSGYQGEYSNVVSFVWVE